MIQATAWRLHCRADIDDLPALMRLVQTACVELDASPGEQHDLLLIAEEACVNVMHHAYPDGAGGGMTLQLSAAPHETGWLVTLSVEDAGTPFDPLAPPLPDTGASVEEREIGGLGILLIRELADHVAYRYDAVLGNVLTIEKRLGAQPAPA
jgi:anti-sigma regulatory factor (Ser/Thr protein kinase)